MNDVNKKLDALIDALGFDVEQTRTPVNSNEIAAWNNACRNMPEDIRPSRPMPTFDYKLTKRVEIKGPSYACTKCGTHIAPGNSITSCLCKATKNLIRIDS